MRLNHRFMSVILVASTAFGATACVVETELEESESDVATASDALGNSFQAAVNAALHGPEIKKVKVFGHHFNVKPAEITRTGTKVTAAGQISHHLRWRRDDQVYYYIEKEGGTVKKIELRIDRGGWAPIAGAILGALTPVSAGTITDIGRALGGVIDGSWQGAAQAIIVGVASQL